MRAAVIILSWNGADHLADCLDSVQGQRNNNALTVVVDNGSEDDSVAIARQHNDVQVIENRRNLGFAAGMNVGIRWLRSLVQLPNVVVLLNQDTIVAPDWLHNLIEPLAHDQQIAAVGCKIYYPDGKTLQHAGGWLDPARALSYHFGHQERDEGQYDQPRDVEYVTGASMALRMSALDEVGLLDEGYSPAYFEEVDLCWRLRRSGYRVHYTPGATLRHVESSSIRDPVARNTLAHRNRLRYIYKTFPFERIRVDFMTAERLRLASLPHSLERRILRRAYLEGILRREEWLTARAAFYPISDDEAEQLRHICIELRAAAGNHI